MIQGTEEWFAARCGKVTASRIADVMAKGRGNAPSATRANYVAELVAERLSGTPAEGFKSAAMDWGTETEPQARAMYEFVTGRAVTEVGFVPHPTVDMAGASPDGLVGADGLVEIKCPNTATHIATLTGGAIKDWYVKQMYWQMACTGRQWCDFVSFDPRMPPEMQIHITRLNADPVIIAEITEAVTSFLAEVDETVATLTSLYLLEAAE